MIIRHGFIITFMDIRDNEKQVQEFASYSDYFSAWKECVIYAQSELSSLGGLGKYWIIKSIESV